MPDKNAMAHAHSNRTKDIADKTDTGGPDCISEVFR